MEEKKSERVSNSKGKERANSYTGIGIALGAGLGFIFGLLLFEDNFAVGIGIGVAFGLIVGSILDANQKQD